MGMAHADVGTRHGTEVEGNGINWPGGSFGYSNVVSSSPSRFCLCRGLQSSSLAGT